jgi:hypothetical protein
LNDGFRGSDFAFVRVSETVANKLGRGARWYPVDIDVVKKLKENQAA